MGDMRISIKFVAFLMLLVTLTSCDFKKTNYVREAGEVIEDILVWRGGPLHNYQNAMNAYIDDEGKIASQDGSKGIEVITWYLFADQLKSLTGRHYDGLITYLNSTVSPIISQITHEGFIILSAWNALVPPAELQTAHLQVRDCIEYEINKFKKIEQSYSSSIIIYPDFPENDPCLFFDNAVEMILSP